MAAKKTSKPTKKADLPVKEQVVHSALKLAAQMPWDMVTLTDIADDAGISLAALSDIFDDKCDILVAYGRMIDRAVLAACADPDPSSSERDRLFEILMERFDVLNKNRGAVLSILKSFMPDPKQAVISLPHLGRSMVWMLECAGIETSGIKGCLRVVGLTAVYLACLKTWMKDDSEDLSMTMACVDKNLERAQMVANTISV